MFTFISKIRERRRESRRLTKSFDAFLEAPEQLPTAPEGDATVVQGGVYDEERAFYGAVNCDIRDASFAGPADGESAFKEAYNLTVNHCNFALRYPFWHVRELKIADSVMEETCRAPLWYCSGIDAKVCRMFGTKALRECESARLSACNISSDEFGWRSRRVILENCEIKGAYFFLEGKNVYMNKCNFSGKYSFQYVEDCSITHSVLDTKDALWHAKNVIVENCELRGEYLGWYCENVTFINCRIIGTQPFCYCKNLKLHNCEMVNCDLAFERSTVEATVTTHIDSVKNPLGGYIKAPSIGEIIRDSDKYVCRISTEQVCESAASV